MCLVPDGAGDHAHYWLPGTDLRLQCSVGLKLGSPSLPLFDVASKVNNRIDSTVMAATAGDKNECIIRYFVDLQ